MPFTGLPVDVQLLVRHHLEDVDRICLALSCKHFYTIICQHDSCERLNNIIGFRPLSEYMPRTSDWSRFQLRLLLARLANWAPRDHVRCSKNKDKFIVGGGEGAICIRCREKGNEGTLALLKELHLRVSRGLKLEWYEINWLRAESE